MLTEIESELLTDVTGGGARVAAGRNNIQMVMMMLQQSLQAVIESTKAKAADIGKLLPMMMAWKKGDVGAMASAMAGTPPKAEEKKKD